jgi:hypothetical protein
VLLAGAGEGEGKEVFRVSGWCGLVQSGVHVLVEVGARRFGLATRTSYVVIG